LIARALVGSPKLILLEEPLQDIKVDERDAILNVILSPENTTILIQTDDELIINRATNCITITQGNILH
jgi:ABC-type lipoprotein export system ATPase subunit